jgi:hypothetical protein
MKVKISISVLVIILITSLLTVMGQEVSDKKKQEADARKKKVQVVIVSDSIKTEKDLQKIMEESLAAEEKALKAQKDNGYLDNKEFYKRAEELQLSKKKLQEEIESQSNNWDNKTFYSVPPQVHFQFKDRGTPNVYSMVTGDRENTSLSISKTLEDVTFSTNFYYDVKKESSTVSFFVNGTLKAGELTIILKKPDDTAFQEITISPLADVNWNQTFSWDDNESDEYIGKWTISISAAKANGNYRVQVNSR